ncbi:SAF domain-containing protein [Isoptericola sp. b408]|uniref:SAF domain-containing protein n=1 Tax=Isoptericola sp. b408 TaxID=3064653 RepID=UPI00271292AC|nr:SAF domain-containing protein [Isoptericola sp. b408]MDO8152355.1 SAF domain-containing protein [Isoptericola sp. b408]
MDLSANRQVGAYLRLVVWRSRFVVAACCCGLAAWAVVAAVRPAPPPTLDVLVTAHDVTTGHTLTSDDVTTVPVPAALAPATLLRDPDEALGRTTVVDLAAGTPLSASVVRPGGPAGSAPPGTVVVAVRLTESGWLRPGDRIDLVATDDGGTRLARRAQVLPPAAEDPGSSAVDEPGAGLLGVPGAGDSTGVTLVAVSPEEAPAVSASSGWGAIAPVLVP